MSASDEATGWAMTQYFKNARLTEGEVEAIMQAMAPYAADTIKAAFLRHYQKDEHRGHPKANALAAHAAAIHRQTFGEPAEATTFRRTTIADEERARQAETLAWVEGLTEDEREALKEKVLARVRNPFVRHYMSSRKPLTSVVLRAAMRKAYERDNR